jgi:hypothetical protein
VFVTYQESYNFYPPCTNEIDAVRLDGSRVERICNIRDNNQVFLGDSYLAESHGCPSPDGLRVIFASDWNKGAYPVQAYVVDYRDKVITTSVQATDVRLLSSGPSLIGNYPNPFNPTTAISFQLPAPSGAEGSALSFVTLEVFDILGRKVATLVDKELQPGSYQTTFDGSHLNSGVYLYQMRAGRFMQTGRMVLTK